MTALIIGGDVEDWGIIPTFLDINDPRSAREQFDARYIGGWMEFSDRFTWDRDTGVLRYPGDPPMRPVSGMLFRDEIILLYPSAFVLITKRGSDEFNVARMD